MDDNLYDEFGNYIGPELSESGEEDVIVRAPFGEVEQEEEEEEEGVDPNGMHLAAPMEEDEGVPGMQVILHEDKKYYPSAEETYGRETETLVEEEDAQPLEVPIIAPIKQVRFQIDSEKLDFVPKASPEFLATLVSTPELIRNVAVVGHLHHGKTVLMDMLVEQTHDLVGAAAPTPDRPLRFTDTRLDEQARGISLKAVPMTLVAEGSSGKNYALSLCVCPGHLNFADEMDAAMRLADGVLLVVDAAEGVMSGTRRAIAQAAAEGLSLSLIVTKVDRLFLELKLPPADAYFKLRHIIEEVNGIVRTFYQDKAVVLNPAKGNVAFAAPLYGWSFTLESFASLYVSIQNIPMDPQQFAKKLWGDMFYSPSTRAFSKDSSSGERSFLEFILNPLYKLHSQIIAEDEECVAETLATFDVQLKASSYEQDVKPLLKEAMKAVFGTATGLVDMLVRTVPSARAGSLNKVERCYTGPQDGELAAHMRACNAKGPLVIYICKLFPKSDVTAFDAFGRIMSGAVKVGDSVRVLGENYTPDDEEDCSVARVSAVWAYEGRYRIPLQKASAGAWVLLEGIDATISKTATVVSEFMPMRGAHEEVYIFAPIKHSTQSVVKIATEPLNPSELPKLVEGLRRLNKSYPLLITRVEESGEHTLFGTGELYLDSAMKDLRELYAEVEIKVADPVVSFCETVVETSTLKCYAESPNKKNKLTMIAEPLEKGIAEDVEKGVLRPEWSRKQLSNFLQTKYDWDIVAARSLWAFGPDVDGPNALLDDSLPGEVDKAMLSAIKESVIQGFRWGAREGPLCDEPMRNVKFKVLDADIAQEPLHRGGGQIIPTSRRVCYSSFLMATPRLMEPVYAVEILTPSDCISVIYNILGKRRGHITADLPKPGTPVFIVQAYLPVIESFGFETDLRYHTQGQAFCMSTFDHWQVVPGDPLDRTIILRPLEPAPMQALARDFMVKTRRRKGMTDDVSISKFFDDPLLLELAQQDAGMML